LGCYSVAVHIYTQTIHRTTQMTTNVEECGPCSVFASFTLAFALQLRKKHGKTSVKVRKTSVRVQYTYYQTPTHYKTLTNTPLQNPHIRTHARTHAHTHTHTLQNNIIFLFSFIGKISNLVSWVVLHILFLESLDIWLLRVVIIYSSVLACYLMNDAVTDYTVETDR
jgi:hypothetical protein